MQTCHRVAERGLRWEETGECGMFGFVGQLCWEVRTWGFLFCFYIGGMCCVVAMGVTKWSRTECATIAVSRLSILIG